MSKPQNTDPKNSKDHGIDIYHDLDPDADKAGQLNTIYADWADKYDEDNDNKLKTVSQPTTVELFAKHITDASVEILDVGCGTGIVGKFLKRSGFTTYDGTDPTLEMLNLADKHGYRHLFPLEPGEPLPVDDASYDAAFCVGVFTHGHLGPEGFDELLRVTKPGGMIAFTVNEGVWEPGRFAPAIEALSVQEKWHVIEQVKRDYMVNEGVQAWYIVACKT